MKWRLAGWIAVGALLVCAMQAMAAGLQDNKQKTVAKKPPTPKALVAQANAALQNKQWKQAENLLQQLIEIDDEMWSYWQDLGTAQMNLGKYDEALNSFAEGIMVAEKELESKEPTKDAVKVKPGIAMMLTFEGNAYLKLKKYNLAITAYTKAAAIDPNAALPYFNLCATQYNMGNMAEAEAACDKAIAADPKMADAYFIKGSVLYGDAKVDAKGVFVLPPGTLEALKKYLELAPEGPHAADVKAMLEAAGVKL